MPRVIKHPDLRRAELLDHSLKLFLERGFTNTSLNDVIAESDVSKGAFYHYFSSKDELLDALATRFAEERLRALNLPARKPKDDSAKRLNQLLSSLRQLRVEIIGIPNQDVAALFRPENHELYQRITVAWERIFRPVFIKVFTEGVSEGTFHTDDPEGVADLLLMVIAQGRVLIEKALVGKESLTNAEAARIIDRRAKLHGLMIDRLLQLKDGTILTAEQGFGRNLLAEFKPTKPKATKGKQGSRTPRA